MTAKKGEDIDVYISTFELCVPSRYRVVSIKVVPEQSGKVKYERERLAGDYNGTYISDPPASLYLIFPLCFGTTLIEIAVYSSSANRLTITWLIFCYVTIYNSVTRYKLKLTVPTCKRVIKHKH